MVGQVSLWMVLFVLFETAATFIRLMPLFVADVASSLKALVLAFFVLASVPLGSLFPLQAFGSRRFTL